ncbi:MAG: hypothetical protein MUF69_07405 [Desulfobacterota bacterium]|nr:hypothetical protein [Thermodesulfobacteriota bacterium]
MIGIASILGWQYQILDEDWSAPGNAVLEHSEDSSEIKGYLGLKGIQLTPPGVSESLDFFFNAQGYLLSPLSVISIQAGVLEPDEAWISVKTQFLTPEMHVMIIGLLQYIKERHLPSLEVHDEGEYWDTGDYRKLENKMKLVQGKIDDLSRELSSECLGEMAGLSADEIADRIERLFQDEEPKSGYIH